MATWYGLRCPTCNKETEISVRRGPGSLRELVAFWPVIARLHKDSGFLLSVTPLGLEEGGNEDLVGFLESHYGPGHPVVVRDEYGTDHPAPQWPPSTLEQAAKTAVEQALGTAQVPPELRQALVQHILAFYSGHLEWVLPPGGVL